MDYRLSASGLVALMAMVIFGAPTASAQAAAADLPVPATPLAKPLEQVPVDKRIFGVLPNYRTVNGTAGVEPITARQKFHIAMKDSFDWPGYLVGGAFAALYQLEDSNPGFGQGLKGYGHRYVTAYADQVSGNMMTEGILPSLLHEDPRYFRRGEGTTRSRFGYSATRIFVTRTDAGKWRFNTSEVLGNAITASLANAYYPDNRSLSDTTQRLYTQLATDCFSNIVKEFWPDIKRHVLHK
jgi:hypothetical protein